MDLGDPLYVGRKFRRMMSFAILPVACILVTLGGCSRVSERHAEKAPGATQPTAAFHEREFPHCPDADPPTLKRGSRRASPHKVVLFWNASVPSPGAERGDLRYCLYRSMGHKVTPKKTKQKRQTEAPCENCERVNLNPIIGTGCVDDLVQSDTRYYYAAVAINRYGELSVLSNQAPAPIPPNTVPVKPVPPSGYPMCREDADPKQDRNPASAADH